MLLALLFLMSGATKLFTSLEAQRTSMEWAKNTSDSIIYFAGIAEILGTLGLILPAILKIKPWLTSLAALGLSSVMIMAAALNGSIGESKAILPTLLISVVLLFVAWGRYKMAPIKTK
ncbi:MAG: DoxX family protein [Bacteroidetes bacterium]|nr:DoxX family protein [Bacteroidota bacterium]